MDGAEIFWVLIVAMLLSRSDKYIHGNLGR